MVPLMEAALERANALASGDPVAAGLAVYLEHHIPEEMHSDVPGDAVVDDLAALGLEPDEMRALPTIPQIAELVAAQLEWINGDHPVAILGFLELEAHQADRPTVEQLIERTGLPRAAFGQLLLHARLDVVHAKEFHRVIDELPLEPRHEELIGLSALRSMLLVTHAMLSAIESASAGHELLGDYAAAVSVPPGGADRETRSHSTPAAQQASPAHDQPRVPSEGWARQ